MINKINDLLSRVEEFAPKSAAEVEEFRIKILGKKGEMNALLEEFKSVAPELKREFGQKINQLKNRALERVNTLKEEFAASATPASAIGDMTRPGSGEELGSRHPISLVKNEICDIFSRLGYTIADGPEIEDDWHVFVTVRFADIKLNKGENTIVISVTTNDGANFDYIEIYSEKDLK